MENLSLRLRDAEVEISQARNKLETKRNWCIQVENDFKMIIEDTRKRTTKDILEQVHLEADVEREGERQQMWEEASQEVETKYLASDAFGLVRVDCFWEGFEEFWDITSELFPDIDFSFIQPRGTEAEDQGEEEDGQGDAMVDGGATEGD